MSDNISVDDYQWIIDVLDDENDMLVILILIQEEEDTAIAYETEKFFFYRDRHVYQSKEIPIWRLEPL